MNSFFDVFKWDRFVAPSAMELLFWLLAAIAVLFGLWGLASGLALVDGNPLQGLVLIAVSIVGALAAIIAARVACEAIVILFRVNENLMDIAERGLAIAQPVVESEAVRLERRMAEARERAANRASEPATASDRPTIDHRLIEAKPAEPERDPFAPDRGRVEPKAWDVKPAEARAAEPRAAEPRLAEEAKAEPVIRIAPEPSLREDKIEAAPVAEPKPAEPRLPAPKPHPSRAGEGKAGDAKSAASRSGEIRPAEPRPAEQRPVEPRTAEAKPTEPRPERRSQATASGSAPEPKTQPRPAPRRAPQQVEPAIEHALKRLSEPAGTEAMRAGLAAAAEEARRTEALHEAALAEFEREDEDWLPPPSEDDDVTPLPAFIGRHEEVVPPEPARTDFAPPLNRTRRRSNGAVSEPITVEPVAEPRARSQRDARSMDAGAEGSPLRGPARRPDQQYQRQADAAAESPYRDRDVDDRSRGHGQARGGQERDHPANRSGTSGQGGQAPKAGPSSKGGSPAPKGGPSGKGGQPAKGGQAPLKRRRPRPSRDDG